MVDFDSREHLLGMLDWFDKNSTFPSPKTAWVEYFGTTHKHQNSTRINFGDKFSITFKGFDSIKDLLTCDVNKESKDRVLQMLKDAILEKQVNVGAIPLMKLPTSIKIRAVGFARKWHEVEYQ